MDHGPILTITKMIQEMLDIISRVPKGKVRSYVRPTQCSDYTWSIESTASLQKHIDLDKILIKIY